MSHFDTVARTWDENPMHTERSKAIAAELTLGLPLTNKMSALEYGAGTAILSFILANEFSEITLMDNSSEMVNVMNEKIAKYGLTHLKPLKFDLEHNAYTYKTFDIIYSQMVMHHVDNIDMMFAKFSNLLKPGGYLAIADLYAEDGTFHDSGFTGHKGFDPEILGNTLKNIGFKAIKHKPVYVIKRQLENSTVKEFPIFLLTAEI